MKTTKKKITALVCTVASVLAVVLPQPLLCSCQQADEPQPVPEQGVPLRLVSGISTVQTRAFDSSWNYGDEIGVFTTVAGTTTVTKSGVNNDENVGYKIANAEFNGSTNPINTYNSTGGSYLYKSFAPSAQNSQIYLPANGSDVDVYAYYPWTTGVSASSPLNITVPTTQYASGNNENQKAVDVLKASYKTDVTDEDPTKHIHVNIDNTTAQLQFSHIMSKVLVRVVVGEGYGASDLNGTNISSVVLSGQPTVATFAPVTQALTITSGSNAITMAELASGDADYVTTATISNVEHNVIHNYRAIILPNTDATGTNPVTSGTQRQIQFNVGSVTYSYNITQNFQPGYQTVYTIILAANEVTVTAAITPWTPNAIPITEPLYPNS